MNPRRFEPMLFASVLSATLLSRPALAAPTVQDCTEAYTRGQEFKLDGEWLKSKMAFDICADPACPKVASTDCIAWRDEALAHLSLVTLLAQGDDGAPLANAQVYVDGTREVTLTDLTLNPGRHQFRFQAAGHEDAALSIEVSAGERRPVVAILYRTRPMPTPTTSPPAQPNAQSTRAERSSRWSPLSVGGLGLTVAAAGTALGLGLSAKADYEQLHKTCGPHCTDSQVAPLRTRLLLANICGGVSAAAALTTLYLVLWRAPHQSTVLALSAAPGGGQAWLGGKF